MGEVTKGTRRCLVGRPAAAGRRGDSGSQYLESDLNPKCALDEVEEVGGGEAGSGKDGFEVQGRRLSGSRGLR
jgi:hypothetical protein